MNRSTATEYPPSVNYDEINFFLRLRLVGIIVGDDNFFFSFFLFFPPQQVTNKGGGGWGKPIVTVM